MTHDRRTNARTSVKDAQARAASARSGQGCDSAPLISVVVTCFNHARFLGEAIESVLAQSCQDFQLIVIDDGSTDATPDVAGRYDRVRYFRQTNQGLPAARNAGLDASGSRYLVFLDADDRLLPDALKAGLQCFAEHPECAFVSGGHRRIDEAGTVIELPTPPHVEHDHYLALLRGNYVGMHAAVMYRRQSLAAVGGFRKTLPACEDYDLYLRLARLHPVCCHEIVVADYRTYATSMSTNIGIMLPTALRVLRWQRPYFSEDPRRITAYRVGLKYWRGLYAHRFVDQVSLYWSQGEFSKFISGAVATGWHAPVPLGASAYHRWVRPMLPTSLLRLAARLGGRSYWPSVGKIRFGDLRRVTPISERFGADRGLAVDRYYLQKFLAAHAADIQGRVLEIGDATYTREFGGDRVTKSDVLHVVAENAQATIVGDLTAADHIPSNAFDCAIVTQTLHLIYDVRSALDTLYRILKPGGVLLVTGPGISQISNDRWAESWSWSFTTYSMRRLLQESFPPESVDVEAFGNVLAATAFLQGIAAGECKPRELDVRDRQYEVLVAARAVKPEDG